MLRLQQFELVRGMVTWTRRRIIVTLMTPRTPRSSRVPWLARIPITARSSKRKYHEISY